MSARVRDAKLWQSIREDERQRVLGELRERVEAVKREPRYSDFVATVAHENACDDLLAIIDELAGSE